MYAEKINFQHKNHNFLKYIFLSLVFLTVGCEVKKSTKEESNSQQPSVLSQNNESKKLGNEENLAKTNESTENVGLIEILVSKKMIQSGYCNFIFEVANKTKINFSDLAVDLLYRDSNNNIIEKTSFRERVAPNSTMVTTRLQSKCAEISEIEITGLNSTTLIDGTYVKNKNLLDIPIKSASKVQGLNVKSAGGTLATSTQITKTKNALETAVDPYNGNWQLWTDFKDAGGLNSENNYYGLDIHNINLEFDNQNRIKFVLLYVSKSNSPKEIRTSLNQACKSKENSWVREDNGFQSTGDVKVGKVKCSYLTSNTGTYHEVYMVVDQ